ncbi:hypothetical protein CBFG_02422 [Clostridiales bacterium 1_7_47FAA]|nr:hypothetical protein CBFG_02422 [Clostridiales bacterium 1_7_47FAA]
MTGFWKKEAEARKRKNPKGRIKKEESKRKNQREDGRIYERCIECI